MIKLSLKKAKAAAKAIENNTTLTSIDLSYNDIGDEGAKAIDVALVSNIFILKVHEVESEAVLDQTQERNYAVRDTKKDKPMVYRLLRIFRLYRLTTISFLMGSVVIILPL